MEIMTTPGNNAGTRARGHLLGSWALVVLVGIFAVGPLVWILVTSLKVPGTEFRLPLEYLPDNPTLENYRIVLGEDFRIQRAILNSLTVSGTAMVGTLILSSLGGYAVARLRFRFRLQSLVAVQAAGLIPPIIVIGPTFVLIRAMGLLGTLWGMILPNIVYGVPLALLLMSSYFATLPVEIEDAARIDGASPLTVYLKVLLPLSLPGLFSAGVLSFLGSWGEFMHAFTVSLGIPEVQTVPVAILSFSQAFQLQWTWVAAGTILAVLPVVLLVVVFQRFVISGLTTGAVN